MGHFGKALLGKLGVNLGRSQIIREALGKVGENFWEARKVKEKFRDYIEIKEYKIINPL